MIRFDFLLFRRKMHLQTFIKTLSETGHGAKLSLFPFTDLQDEVERALNKGARQTPVLAHPNYHTILYAYHTYRGDYRNGMQSAYSVEHLESCDFRTCLTSCSLFLFFYMF